MAQPQDSGNVRWPLTFQPDQRYFIPGVDAVMVNCYSEKQADGRVFVYKRGALQLVQASTGTCYGIGLWSSYQQASNTKFGGEVVIIPTANHLYTYGLSAASSIQPPGISEILQGGSTPISVPSIGANGPTGSYRGVGACAGSTYILFTWDINSGANRTLRSNTYAQFQGASGGAVQIGNTNGTPCCWGSATLDQTTYVMDYAGNIWGSNLGDPTTWSISNVIEAVDEADSGVALAKQESFIVAFKLKSIQFFQDNANALGSPLGQVPNTTIKWGCLTPVVTIGNDLYFIGSEYGSQNASVCRLRGLKLDVISNPAIDRLLENAGVLSYGGAALGAPAFPVWSVGDAGHTFYGITLPSINQTLVYDTKENQWAKWTDVNGNYLPVQWGIASILVDYTGNIYTYGALGTASQSLLFPVDIYTPNFDGGTRSKKTLQSLEILGDQNPGNVVQLRRSDNDYQSWSNFKAVDMSLGRARITRLGTFRRRAYHIHTYNTQPMRLEGIEVTLLPGTD